MAGEDDIVQKVVIEGEADAVEAFDRIGKAGEDAFEKVGQAASAASEPTGAIAAAARRSGTSIDEMRDRVAKASAGAAEFGKSSAGAAKSLEVQGAAAKAAAAEIKEVEQAANQASTSARRFGAALQLFSRLAHVPEITQLGRAVRLLSRGLQALAVPVSLVFMDRLAKASADTAREQEELALKSKLTAEQFGELAAAGTAAGISQEDFAKSLDAVGKMLKDGAHHQQTYDEKMRTLGQRIEDTQHKLDDLSEKFSELAIHGARAMRDLTQASEDLEIQSANSSRSFATSLRSIEEQRADILSGGVKAAVARSRKLRDLDESEAELNRKRTQELRKQQQDRVKLSEREDDQKQKQIQQLHQLQDQQKALTRQQEEARREARLATEEFEKNKTALQKLGVASNESSQKLRETPETLLEIADKLKALPPGLEKTKIEAQLVASGISKDLLPALREGSAEFQRLQALGALIRPPFTQQEIDIANKFSVASSQVGDAIGSLKDRFGAALQPAFLDFLEQMRNLFIQIRPGVEEFGTTLANTVKPILDGIAVIITQVLVPAFRGLVSILDTIAAKINEFAGTNVTGMDLLVAGVLALAAAFAPLPIAIIAAVAAIGQLGPFLEKNRGLVVAIAIAIAALAIAFGSIPIAIAAVILAIGLIAARWDDIKVLGMAAIGAVKQAFTEFGDWLNGLWLSLQAAPSQFWEWLKSGFQSAWDAVTSLGRTALDSITSFFDPVIQKAKALWEIIKSIFLGQKAIANKSTDPNQPGGLAGGGLVWGRGTSTSDSILARLSKGEFVQRAAAVSHYGPGFMEAINNMRVPISAIRGFAGGGSVDGGGVSAAGISDWIFSAWRGVNDRVANDLKEIVDKIGRTIDELQGIANRSIKTFSGGGPVWGQGTSTSDSILARLSKGEFVQRAKAVRYYGTNIMHALNNMQIPVGALRGFASGGLVEMLGSPLAIPAFAGGGDLPARALVGASGRPIILDFGGSDRFQVTAESNTAEKIGGYAVRRRMASAGKRPSSWGSK